MAIQAIMGTTHSGHAAARPPDDLDHGSIESQAAPPHSSPLFSTPPRPPHRQSIQRDEDAHSRDAFDHHRSAAKVLPTHTPAAAASGTDGRASPTDSLTYLSSEDDDSYSSSDEPRPGRGDPSHLKLPRWTRKESELLRSGYARHGQKWHIIAKEVEAAGGRKRSLSSYSSHFHRLRHKGFIDVDAPGAVGKGRLDFPSQAASRQQTSSATPCRPPMATSTATLARAKPGAHQWTSEEKEFVLRAGDRYCAPGALDKEANLYSAWKKRFPHSQLTAHVVLVYYHYLRKHILDKQGGSGSGHSTPSKSSAGPSSRPTSSSYPIRAPPSTVTSAASTPRRASAGKFQRTYKGKLWDAAEVQALERCHRMLVAQKINWRGTSALYDTFRKIMPRTERTHDAVRSKYLSLFEQDEEDSEESDSLDSEGQVQEGDSTMLTPPHSEDTSRHGTYSRKSTATTMTQPSPAGLKAELKPFANQQHYADNCFSGAQPSAPQTVYTATTSFNQSFPPIASNQPLPTLNVLTSVTPEGLLFENAHAGLGIAVFAPQSFKLLGPQQMAALAQLPIDEQPAFALNVLEGGAIQMVNMPEGTTSSMRVIPAEGGGRMGVESRVTGPDGYTLVIVVWL